MKRTWTEQEYQMLRENYPISSLPELQVLFPGKTAKAIRAKAKVLGIKKARTRFCFSAEQIEILKQKCANTLNAELAGMLGCPVYSIHNKAYSLGLKKDKQFIAGLARMQMQNPNHPGRKYWIKKGNVPVNKGRKQTEYMTPEAIEKTKSTRFKKGNLPHNACPVGYERVDRDGYVYIKVEGKRKLVLKHRYIWQKHNGPIPEGYNIQFKDGNRQNCNIENLYMISRDKQMTENTIHRYPSEIKTAIRRINKLNKLIKDENKY